MANLNFPEVKDRDPNAEVDMEVLNDTIEYIRPAVQADGGDLDGKPRRMPADTAEKMASWLVEQPPDFTKLQTSEGK